MNVFALLRRYARPIQGGPPAPLDIDGLRRDLASIRRSNRVGFRICAGMLVVLFATALLSFLLVESHALQLGAYAVGFGVAFLVAFQMQTLWKDKVTTDLLTVLAGTCREELLQTVVTALFADAVARRSARAPRSPGPDWIGEVHEAAVDSGLGKVREALLAGIPPEFVAQMPLTLL